MTRTDIDTGAAAARACQQQLIEWLRHKAYPIWAHRGVDAGNGGFQERLSQDEVERIRL